MNKEFEMTFLIDGVQVGSSFLVAMGKTLLTDAAEDEFFAVLRKNEARLLQEALDEERDFLIDHLTPAQTELLQHAHGETYHGTDDDMPDAYEGWLDDLSLDELKDLLK